jgi:cardiolipin synthase
MDWPIPLGVVTTIAHWVVVLALSGRVIAQRRPAGVSLAWITIIAVLPLFGALCYLMVGELWLAGRRVRRGRALNPAFVARLGELHEQAPGGLENHSHLARTLDAYASRGEGMPTLGGNVVRVFREADSAFDALIADIDAAEHRVYMLFFIWCAGGRADEVGAALMRAAGRGVDCRLLLDNVGSKDFLRSAVRGRFEEAGVRVVAALHAGALRLLLHRLDMRNHRKIVAIDGKVGYCGSLNIADPRLFKTDAGVGQWVDVMCRIDGPGGEALELTFQHDWCIEAEKVEPALFVDIHPEPYLPGQTPVQLINSGPGQSPHATEYMLLTMIFASERWLTLTTPYFIPTDAMEQALIAAARRGVEVRIVVPERNDSRLVALASRSYYGDLLEAGIRIWEYRRGLLHAKTVVADGRVSLVGSANMDRRSFEINYESNMFVYDNAVAEDLGKLQQSYIEDSREVDRAVWLRRGRARRLAENATQLVSPLL